MTSLSVNQTLDERSPYSNTSQLTVLANGAATWIIYPSRFTSAFMRVWLLDYYKSHADKFRPWETLEISAYDILGPAISDYTLINSPDYTRKRLKKYSKTNEHGTLEGKLAGCRCRACVFAE